MRVRYGGNNITAWPRIMQEPIFKMWRSKIIRVVTRFEGLRALRLVPRVGSDGESDADDEDVMEDDLDRRSAWG